MATDCRISTSLPSHPKTKKLVRRLGPQGGWALVCLFLWAAGNRSNGDLSGLSTEDIELAADWTGEEGAFVRELAAIGFLEGVESSYLIHDWEQHNPWAAGSDQRSYKAKWNAAKRHHGEAEADRLVPEYAAIRNASSNASSKPAADEQQATSNAPSPSPSPSPSVETAKAEARATRLPQDWVLPDGWREWAKAERKDLDPIKTAERFRDHWVAKPGKEGRKLDWEATWRNWVRNQWQAPQPKQYTPLHSQPSLTVINTEYERTKEEQQERDKHAAEATPPPTHIRERLGAIKREIGAKA